MRIRVSRMLIFYRVFIALSLLIIDVRIVKLLADGENYLALLLLALICTFFAIYLAIENLTTKLTLEGDNLKLTSLFRHQELQTNVIEKSAIYWVGAPSPTHPRLRLEDGHGNILILSPQQYVKKDLSLLFDFIYPRIPAAVAKIDKSYENLRNSLKQR